MIQSVERALDIMMIISDNHGQPVTISEISNKLKLNQSTCCHIVETLVDKGFLNQVSRSAGYVLGVYAYNLTRYKDFHRDLILTSMPILRWMQNKTGYTSLLASLIDSDKFVLCYSDNPDNPLSNRGDLYKGTLYDAATGRAMLSTLKPKELKKLIIKVGLPKQEEWPDVDTYEKLQKELLKISKQKIVRAEFIENNKYICKVSIPFLGPKQERFAIGLEIKKDKKPNKQELDLVDKTIYTGTQEIIRRMKFENIGG